MPCSISATKNVHVLHDHVINSLAIKRVPKLLKANTSHFTCKII